MFYRYNSKFLLDRVTSCRFNLHDGFSRKNLKASDALSFGNKFYQIRFEQKDTFPVYGHKYYFHLEDAIDDCAEFLVHFPHLVRYTHDLITNLALDFW